MTYGALGATCWGNPTPTSYLGRDLFLTCNYYQLIIFIISCVQFLPPRVAGELPQRLLRPTVLDEGLGARIYVNYIGLLDESERDKLTGLYNRRTFERHMQHPTKRLDDGEAKEPASPRWLAILDIDQFKRINDTWGHVYDDEVILVIAQQMRASFRQGEALFRFGDEDFLVLLESDDHAAAGVALERFRMRVQEYVFRRSAKSPGAWATPHWARTTTPPPSSTAPARRCISPRTTIATRSSTTKTCAPRAHWTRARQRAASTCSDYPPPARFVRSEFRARGRCRGSG